VKRIVAILSGVALLLGLASVVPAQASSAQAPAHIVNLGDSYGSGVGAGDYAAGTENNCWRSKYSAAQVVVDALLAEGFPVEFSNVACSGATINDLRRPYQGVVQLNALRSDTRLIFLTIGGNDLKFVDVVTQCLAQGTTCAGKDGEIKKARKRLPGMGLNLFTLLLEIKARSPQAKIVLLGYGQQMTRGSNAAVAPLDPICGPEFFADVERQEGGQLSADVDWTLRNTAKIAKQYGGVQVTFISPYASSNVDGLSPQFVGHSLCEAPIFDPATGQPGQYYRGFDAVPPSPFADPAGQTAILHMNRAGHALLAFKVITEAPGSSVLASLAS
jgi:lysophospholipase L1-like esterase